MQVYPVLPPQDPSGLNFRVHEGGLEKVFDVVDTTIEVLDVLEATSRLGFNGKPHTQPDSLYRTKPMSFRNIRS